MDLQITKKQEQFINATEFEVLFGGAAGGGKSKGQLIDALLYALKYAGSKQLMLRRTFPELEKSLIREALAFYPREVCKYNESKHVFTFKNKSVIDFGYCDNENSVYQYQSAEYDVVRFDELTHFTEFMYTYLMSRCRGVNDFPKQVKSSTNPGGVGHMFVKERFIDPAPAEQTFDTENGARVFIPSKVQDNVFLMESDPGYLKRLDNLSERDRKQLKDGDWNYFDGQYFSDFSKDVHVIKPFDIPEDWRIYRTIDYGRDMCAVYDIAVDWRNNAYVVRELYQSGLLVSKAAEEMHKMWTNEEGNSVKIEPYITLAPPDLWNTSAQTGKSISDLFADGGHIFTRCSNNRVAGWLALQEWLKPYDFNGEVSAKLRIFNTCVNLIRTLPALQVDPKRPTDCMTEPHELTHAPDSIRNFAIYWTHPPEPAAQVGVKWSRDLIEDYFNANEEGRQYLIAKYGQPSNLY